MTSQSVFFNGRVNLIAPVEASLKSISIRQFQVKQWKMYITQSENSQSKISKFQFLHAVTLLGPNFSPFRPISYDFRDNGKFTFSRSSDLEGHVTLKSKNLTIYYFECSNPKRVNSEISVFFNFSIFFQFLKFLNFKK